MGASGIIWQQAAANAASGALGIGIQRLGAGYDRKQQLKTQQGLMNLQMSGERQMMDYQQQKELEMWEKTGYGPQVEQMKAAGINPALMYGHGGATGQTIGHGGSPAVAGGQAPYINTAEIGMELGMKIANMELIKSQAEKNRAETAKISGVDTEKTSAETKSITQGINNQKAAEALTRAQTKIATIEFNVAEQSQDDRIKRIHAETNNAIDTAHIAMNEAGISDAVQQDKINILKAEAVGKIIENNLNQIKITATKEEINKWATELAQGWAKLDQNQQHLRLEQFESKVKAKYPGVSQMIGGAMKQSVEMLLNKIGIKTDYTTSEPPKIK